jgi:2-polyprenyl-6-methoxyphenol hydroxylase-like FAD-dependent oxidoreductase
MLGVQPVREVSLQLTAAAPSHLVGPLTFFPNTDAWSDRLYDVRVVLIGDVAGANDPSGGHGLSL